MALVPGDGEAAFLEQLGIVFFGLGPVEGVVPLVRCVAHAETPDGLVADAALGQVVARDLCRAIVGQGDFPAPGHLLVQRSQFFLERAFLALAGRHLEFNRNPSPLGQALHGLDECQVFELPQKRKNIAALVATEAVENLLGRTDVETRGLLLVERA